MEVLTAKQAAQMYQVNIYTIYKWANQGLIGRKVGIGTNTRWRFTRQELEDLLKRNGDERTES